MTAPKFIKFSREGVEVTLPWNATLELTLKTNKVPFTLVT